MLQRRYREGKSRSISREAHRAKSRLRGRLNSVLRLKQGGYDVYHREKAD
jgi:hypothetical protein